MAATPPPGSTSEFPSLRQLQIFVLQQVLSQVHRRIQREILRFDWDPQRRHWASWKWHLHDAVVTNRHNEKKRHKPTGRWLVSFFVDCSTSGRHRFSVDILWNIGCDSTQIPVSSSVDYGTSSNSNGCFDLTADSMNWSWLSSDRLPIAK